MLCFDYAPGEPLQLAEDVRARYNFLLADDSQPIQVGVDHLAPDAVVVAPGAEIEHFGQLLDTPRCNGAPVGCDDRYFVPDSGECDIHTPFNRADVTFGFNHIFKLAGSTLSKLGPGVNDAVYALALDGAGDLYAGGAFYRLGDGTSLYRIGKWNGSTWSALGDG